MSVSGQEYGGCGGLVVPTSTKEGTFVLEERLVGQARFLENFVDDEPDAGQRTPFLGQKEEF
jgi:hypothetical protein